MNCAPKQSKQNGLSNAILKRIEGTVNIEILSITFQRWIGRNWANLIDVETFAMVASRYHVVEVRGERAQVIHTSRSRRDEVGDRKRELRSSSDAQPARKAQFHTAYASITIQGDC